jgi:hypothetical protein
MSNSSKDQSLLVTDQSLLVTDEHRIRESLSSLLTEAGYDVCFDQVNELADDSAHDRSVHRIVLTARGSTTSPPSAGFVERFPIGARSEKPLPATTTHNRVTYQGTIYTICKSCYQLIGSGRAEAIVRSAERYHHCPQMDSEMEAENAIRF